MSPARSRLLKTLISMAFLITVAAVYWAAYRLGHRAGLDAGFVAGLSEKLPERRALAVGIEGGGTSYHWYDLNDPQDAARFRDEEKRLKSIGVDYYIKKGRVTMSIVAEPEPDTRRVDSHR